MKCDKCDSKAVYSYNGTHYCKFHFIKYFENKVQRTIRRFKLINKKDVVAVAVSGGKDSIAVLYNVANYCKKHNIKFFALNIDEGIKDYRDHTIEDMKTFCKDHNINYKIISFKEIYGQTLDEMLKKAKKLRLKPCRICGILRRNLLNQGAKKFNATKLVTGHNIDDEAQSLLMNLFLGNMKHNASLGLITGLNNNEKFVSRIKPLYFITEKETRLYCFLKGFKVEFNECPYITDSFRAKVRDKLNELETERQGIKHSIVNSFLEIHELLKNNYKNKKEFHYCKICGEPSSKDICNTCELIQILNTKE